jgi:hypothetical protein
MTELQKMLFFRARILEGKTKKQACQELSRQQRIERQNNQLCWIKQE